MIDIAMNRDLNTPIWQLTIGEFLELQKRAEPHKEETTPTSFKTEDRLVYGIGGLAKLFGCSKTTAGKIKASGIIDRAISQTGRTITIDAALALKLTGRKR